MEITELLHRAGKGDPSALDAVIPLVYEELKKLASARLRREVDAEPLQTTALVHEAYLKLAGGHQPAYENRSHFYGIASRLMRQILVDSARARAAGKRGADRSVRAGVDLASLEDPGGTPDESLLRLEEALEKLAQTDPLKVRLVEMRYFGGMTAEESAETLSISVHMVRKDLRLAQAWLRREMAH